MSIRREPGDFVVVERLLPAATRSLRPRPAPGCLNAVYQVRKQGLTTTEAVRRLARLLGVPAGRVDYAGLKDKHAVTTQHFSVPAGDQRAGGAWPETLTDEGAPGLSARRVGWCSHPVTAAWIEANQFEIVVRGLTAARADELVHWAGALAEAGGWFVNYFGDQRFGSARHGQGFAAAAMIAGDFERALRLLIGTPARKDSGSRREFVRAVGAHWGNWRDALAAAPPCPERRAVEALARGAPYRDALLALPAGLLDLAVDALQSHLWNHAASTLVSGELALRVRMVPSATDVLAYPEPGSLPECWRTLRVPAPSPGLALSPPWDASMHAALRASDLTLDGLTIPGVRRPAFGAFDRPLLASAAGLTCSAPERDELGDPARGRARVTVRVALPAGAYATTLLRALGE